MYSYIPKDAQVKGVRLGELIYENFDMLLKSDKDIVEAALKFSVKNISSVPSKFLQDNFHTVEDFENFFLPIAKKSKDDNHLYFLHTNQKNKIVQDFLCSIDNFVKIISIGKVNECQALLAILEKSHPVFHDIKWLKEMVSELVNLGYAGSLNTLFKELINEKKPVVQYFDEDVLIYFFFDIAYMWRVPAFMNHLNDFDKLNEFLHKAVDAGVLPLGANKSQIISEYWDEIFLPNFFSQLTPEMVAKSLASSGKNWDLDSLSAWCGKKDINVLYLYVKAVIDAGYEVNYEYFDNWMKFGSFLKLIENNPEIFKYFLENISGAYKQLVENILNSPSDYVKSYVDGAKILKNIPIQISAEN